MNLIEPMYLLPNVFSELLLFVNFKLFYGSVQTRTPPSGPTVLARPKPFNLGLSFLSNFHLRTSLSPNSLATTPKDDENYEEYCQRDGSRDDKSFGSENANHRKDLNNLPGEDRQLCLPGCLNSAASEKLTKATKHLPAIAPASPSLTMPPPSSRGWGWCQKRNEKR